MNTTPGMCPIRAPQNTLECSIVAEGKQTNTYTHTHARTRTPTQRDVLTLDSGHPPESNSQQFQARCVVDLRYYLPIGMYSPGCVRIVYAIRAAVFPNGSHDFNVI